MLTFDEPSHTYRWQGQVVRSVTQYLERLHSFAGVPVDVLEAAKKRGHVPTVTTTKAGAR